MRNSIRRAAFGLLATLTAGVAARAEPPAPAPGAGEAITLRASLTAHQAAWFATFSPDGKALATGGKDQTVRIWDVAAGRETSVIKGLRGTVRGGAFTPDGRRLVTACADRTVRVWDIAAATPAELMRLRGHTRAVNWVVFSPDGSLLATADDGGVIKLWETSTWAERPGPPRQLHPVYCVAFSPDGKSLAAVAGDRQSAASYEITLWEVATLQARWAAQPNTRDVWTLAFSPDGKTLASSGGDGAIALWDVASGAKREGLRVGSFPRPVAYSPDGRLLSTVVYSGDLVVLDATNGQEAARLDGHEGGATFAAFSPDGRVLATAGADGVIKLWDVPAAPWPARAATTTGPRPR